ncbi:hypothetical protein FHG87_015335 [Trinorchestia longiramus]|nr:hypothetical protein FHG87_015335 [Trinorchestia longiramus]
MYYVNSEDELEDLNDLLPLPDLVRARASSGNNAESLATSLAQSTDGENAIPSQNDGVEKPVTQSCVITAQDGEFLLEDYTERECGMGSAKTDDAAEAVPCCTKSPCGSEETTTVEAFSDAGKSILEQSSTRVLIASPKTEMNSNQEIEVPTMPVGHGESVQDDGGNFEVKRAVEICDSECPQLVTEKFLRAMELYNSSAPSSSLPSLHVTSAADDAASERGGKSMSSRNDWVTGMPLVTNLQKRCVSSLSNYSGRSSPLSHRSFRPSTSLSSLHHQKVRPTLSSYLVVAALACKSCLKFGHTSGLHTHGSS